MSRIIAFMSDVIELIIFGLVLSLFAGLWYATQPAVKSVQDQAATQSRLSQESEFSSYDGHIVSGSQLITAMRRYSAKENVYIYVNRSVVGKENFIGNPSRGSTVCFGLDYSSGKLLSSTVPNCSVVVDAMTDEMSPNFIYPRDRFRATVLRDGNDRIAGVYFLQQ